jgi:hypothetical protein
LVWGGVVRDIPAFCRELVTTLAEQERSSTPTNTSMRGELSARLCAFLRAGPCRGERP